MTFASGPNDKRQASRYRMEYPVRISIGSQLTVLGKLKDLSQKSAFITIKTSAYLQMNDEVGFAIQRSPEDETEYIHGLARVSRLVPGEGLAIYFTKMNTDSAAHLKELLE